MQYTVVKTQQIGVENATDPDDAIKQVLDGKGKAGTSSYNATPRPSQGQQAQSRPGGQGG